MSTGRLPAQGSKAVINRLLLLSDISIKIQEAFGPMPRRRGKPMFVWIVHRVTGLLLIGLLAVKFVTAFFLMTKAEKPDWALLLHTRSEERRVGKECRSRWAP